MEPELRRARTDAIYSLRKAAATASRCGGRRRTIGRIDADVVYIHAVAGSRGRCRSGAAADSIREAATHRQIQNDEEAVIDRVRPRGRVHLAGIHCEEIVPIQIPANLFWRDAAVNLDTIGVIAGLAARTGVLPAADTRCLVTGAAGTGEIGRAHV